MTFLDFPARARKAHLGSQRRPQHQTATVRNEFQFGSKDGSHNETDVTPPPPRHPSRCVDSGLSLPEDDLTVLRPRQLFRDIGNPRPKDTKQISPQITHY